jgi:DNA anti-recombination protein RmuC
MSDKKVDVNAKVDDLEAAAEKYASANTVISIGGYEFTPAKLMVAFTIVSTILGGLYASFEVYKDYMDMKTKIAEYVTPDLSELYKKLEVLETSTNKSVEYTQDIKNDLKNDIRRIEGVVEQVERSSKQAQRDTEGEIKSVRNDVRATLDRNRDDMDKIKGTVDNRLDKLQRDTDNKIEKIQRDTDKKIQNALDNPLANK